MLVSSALFAFFISCVIALLATPLARRAGVAMGWRDRPDNSHKMHHAARPYAGGMAVLGACILSLTAWRLAFATYAASMTELLLAIAPGALLIAAVGLLDDLRGCRPVEKLVAQAAALALFQSSTYALGFGGETIYPTSSILIAAVVLNAWMLGLTNSMNLIDGMDGLAAGLASTSAGALALLGIFTGDPGIAAIAAVLCGASLGFRRSNRSPARIYLGDGGSLFLGFGLAAIGASLWLARPSLGLGLTLILITWVPLLDTGTTILRRMRSGVALFQPDRDHLHHRLLGRGATVHSTGRHLIGLNLVGAVAGLGIHFGLSPLVMLALTLLTSIPAIRAALPLRVTAPVPRQDQLDSGDAARTREQAA